MSLLLNQPSKICLGKLVLARSSSLGSDSFSSSLQQTPPCAIISVSPCPYADEIGNLNIKNANERSVTHVEKDVPGELSCPLKHFRFCILGTIGSSHGWVATPLEDGRHRLQDDLNPAASYTDPKHISLPPLVTLPYCQTQLVTNVSMSSSSPEEEDCVVAIKFFGPQLSLCRPAAQNVAVPQLAELTMSKLEILHSCSTSEHLVESQTTGETFLIKWFRKTTRSMLDMPKMKTEALMVFKLDEEGNAVYTEDIGDLVIFLSRAEPFCVPASSFPGMYPNRVEIFDVDEIGSVNLATGTVSTRNSTFNAPYYFPPQNIEHS
uniref:KIB1-4 beta-propeller domain-containing protein n=1 Tax=Brassica oleracea var. oleracea TaxID=109376 RepID=A0A0D3DM71_BRAOL